MEPKRAVYRTGEPFSPFQNQNPSSTIGRKKYLINAPRPGVKADDFRGIASLSNLKRVIVNPVNPKRIMLKDVPVLFQSRHHARKVIKFVPRIVSDTTSATVSVKDNIGAMQEVTTETANNIATPLEKRKLSFGVSCSECYMSFYSRLQLCEHVSSAHGISAQVINKKFDNNDIFHAWLNLIKRTHAVNFVHSSGSRNLSEREEKITYLVCSRSGDPKINQGRNVKRTRGTIKCGKTCLAYLKITQYLRHGYPYGPMKVEGCLQHSGHTIDPEKILLTAEEEQAIQQLIERNPNGPVDITMARAILYPCARFRLITDFNLLRILPKWMWTVRNEDDVDIMLNGIVKEKEEKDEKQHLSQSSGIGDSFNGGIDQQIPTLEYNDSEVLINVDDI